MNGFKKDDSNLLYVQVSDYVREKIYSKEWGVDERIPSEHELMDMFDLSRGTVQKGLKILVDEGLLVQQRGRGTFVTQPVMARPRQSLSQAHRTNRRRGRDILLRRGNRRSKSS